MSRLQYSYKWSLIALIWSVLLLTATNGSLFSSDPSGTSCKEDLDCGSNIKYELCDDGKCQYCRSDTQCDINKENDICVDDHWCEMDKLTKNFDGYTIGTIIAIFVGAFIAAGGGLGGGGIFVPVFILLLNFDAKSASALSQATIFGGSIVNIVMNFREQHPNANRQHRPLTDFNTILVLEPMLLGGTVIGVLLNEILPDPIILVCLILVLTVSLYRMVKKGIAQWKKENEQRARRGEALLANDHLHVQSMVGAADSKDASKYSQNYHSSYFESICLCLPPRPCSTVSTGFFSSSFSLETVSLYIYPCTVICNMYKSETKQTTKTHDVLLLFCVRTVTGSMESVTKPDDKYTDFDGDVDIEILAKKCGQTPSTLKELTNEELTELNILVSKETQVWIPMLWMGAVWVIVSIFALLRSGDFILKVKKCSALYWILEFGVFPCLFVITFFIAKMNMARFNRKLELQWKPAEGDIEWSVAKSMIYPSIAAGAGLLGGLLGIGGGMIISPLLLELGVLPRVASATSAVAVLMTSSSSTFQKILLNMIRYDYMAFFAAIGVVGTFVGQTVVNVAIKKFGRNSIVIAAVASVIAVAIVLMGLNSVLSMHWTFEFDSVC